MRRRSLTFVLISLGLLIAASPAPAQNTPPPAKATPAKSAPSKTAQSKKMTNKDVIDMVGLGLPDDVVIDKIQSATGTNFDTSVVGFKALKAANISNDVIRVMVNPHSTAAPAPAAATPTAAPAPAPAPPAEAPEASEPEPAPAPPPVKLVGHLPAEVGVFVVRKSKLAEIEPEVVGWQTGGAVKHIATLGIDKGHVNGKVMNAKSPLQIGNPVQFIIKTPEGTSATEYQLLHLDVKENRREFRAMTGGVVHASGGTEKNLVAFEPEKIGTRVWQVTIKNLPVGEYGFLPPGSNSGNLATSGKLYSFGVKE